MNPAEQRARHVAVNRAENRLDDMETVITALASEIVKDRTSTADTLKSHRENLARHRENLTTAFACIGDERARIDAFQRMTLYQRLRWLVRGV